MRRTQTGWLIQISWLIVAAIFWGAGSRTAMAAPKDSFDPPENHSLPTKDGASIRITYYKSDLGKDAPVVVLLHGKDENRFVWQSEDAGFAKQLQKAHYAVITVDLRHHGESKVAGVGAGGNINQGKKGKKGAAPELKPVAYEQMVEFDMEAVKNFIYSENQAENLNM